MTRTEPSAPIHVDPLTLLFASANDTLLSRDPANHSSTSGAAGSKQPRIDEDTAHRLIDNLMRDLPGPDGSSAPLGITWSRGQIIDAPFWRDLLHDFRTPISHANDYSSEVLRAALALKTVRLRALGEQMQLGAGLVSRIVYDFLISAVYACESRS